MAKAKTYTPRPSQSLWRAVQIVGWLFIGMSAALAVAYGYRAFLFSGMNAQTYITEMEVIPGHEDEALIIGGLSLLYLLTYLIGGVMVLAWYLRSIRNARVLHRGITISPAWVVWYFILPFISLIRPYTMTSELWRSSLQPESWKGLKDPLVLRWWWFSVLAMSFLSIAANAVSGAATTADVLMGASGLAAANFALGALAGVMFLGITGPISKRQTALVLAGHRPAESTIPAWSV